MHFKKKNVVMSIHQLQKNVQERDTNTRKIQSTKNAPPILDCNISQHCQLPSSLACVYYIVLCSTRTRQSAWPTRSLIHTPPPEKSTRPACGRGQLASVALSMSGKKNDYGRHLPEKFVNFTLVECSFCNHSLSVLMQFKEK